MAFKTIVRKYAFSDSSLAELGDSLVGFAKRDETKMINYGYDLIRLDLIKEQIHEFKEFASDEFYSGLMMEATDDKNKAIKKMSVAAEGIITRAITKWGKDSYRIKAFAWTGYITKKDAEKTAACRVVHRIGTMIQPHLADQGLDAALLDDLKEKISAADEALVMKQVSVGERDAKVNERIAAGNALYQELVKLADTGKHIFKNSNEALYNDYVIYDSPPNLQTVTGTVGTSTIHQPSVDINSKNAVIKITISSPNASLLAYMSDEPTSEPAEGQPVIEIKAATGSTFKAGDLKWTKTHNRLLLKNNSTSAEADFNLSVKSES